MGRQLDDVLAAAAARPSAELNVSALYRRARRRQRAEVAGMASIVVLLLAAVVVGLPRANRVEFADAPPGQSTNGGQGIGEFLATPQPEGLMIRASVELLAAPMALRVTVSDPGYMPAGQRRALHHLTLATDGDVRAVLRNPLWHGGASTADGQTVIIADQQCVAGAVGMAMGQPDGVTFTCTDQQRVLEIAAGVPVVEPLWIQGLDRAMLPGTYTRIVHNEIEIEGEASSGTLSLRFEYRIEPAQP